MTSVGPAASRGQLQSRDEKQAGRPPTMAARQDGAVKGDPHLRAPPNVAGHRNLRRETTSRSRHTRSARTSPLIPSMLFYETRCDSTYRLWPMGRDLVVVPRAVGGTAAKQPADVADTTHSRSRTDLRAKLFSLPGRSESLYRSMTSERLSRWDWRSSEVVELRRCVSRNGAWDSNEKHSPAFLQSLNQGNRNSCARPPRPARTLSPILGSVSEWIPNEP
jgi:hypothetical protein